jgi:hypothetical protein
VKPLFEAIDQGSLPASTSGLTLMEVLVVPYQTGNISLADRYGALTDEKPWHPFYRC